MGNVINIEWLAGEDDQGNWAEGASVRINGEFFLEVIPQVSKFECVSWDAEQVYKLILERLGFKVVEMTTFEPKCA